MLTLHTYFRSSAAYRVRIALNLKKLPYTAVPVHLLRDGGEHHRPEYVQLNPQALLPTLQDSGLPLTQSLAIVEYLEETYPSPALLPPDPAGRARVRALAFSIACDIHPLNNLRVLRYLQNQFSVDQERRDEWYRHWIEVGFAALETSLNGPHCAAGYCHGAAPTIADCCLVPQVYNAHRLRCDMGPYPTIMRIHENCQQLDAFQRAAPAAQPDAE
jgi:maleylacetoacetate isomerase